ncbi:MAG: 3-methyl-2-oxobutanoate hydroxymethyltransferase [Calditrichaceae bacterium]|nr:3-methyl-2-oxobutanoate hydroxymethyltransferase [Calditrichaceae bacterium]RQV97846.1 MAG: 3-methyl-2-oxobutanoate hydroxymethyltransferase [Calditrichota bacterium]
MSDEKQIKRITVPKIKKMKENNQPIAMLTAYDATMAEILDECGIDIVLVGDSAGMVIAGYENTLAVTMEEMIFLTRSVRRGVNRALLVADMPFLSYQAGIDEAVRNAGRFLQEGGAEDVKVEGGSAVEAVVKRMVDVGIPVMGHIGLTPQSINQFGGYGVRGREELVAQSLKDDARILEQAGAFSLVLEKVPAGLAGEITQSINIPTIGIGAGPDCDGQVLVSYDMLGIYEKFKPKFVRRYAEVGKIMREAFIQYIEDVKEKKFPGENESY